MTFQKTACCKVNLLLNVLGQRPDGFHELETIIQPVNLCDSLSVSFRLDPEPRAKSQIELSCDQPNLALDQTNLVWRAAHAFLTAARIDKQVHIHLEKRIPMAAGLAGGSSNAAATLEGLNEMFDQVLSPIELHRLASELGSDVPFFMQPCPALATGRGEHVVSLEPFPALHGAWVVLVYPGFGIPTPWAYQQLTRFPEAQNGKPGRAQRLIQALQTGDLATAGPLFYNALEAPALEKYPLLQMIRECLRDHGAPLSLMSGSGSTVFGIWVEEGTARRAKAKVMERFEGAWCEAVAL